MTYGPILLAPEAEIEETYPYRRVWRTGWLEAGGIFLVVLIVYVLTDFLAILPIITARLPKVGIALLPLIAWIVLTYRAERRAILPRQGLVGVLVLGFLVANGVAVTLEEHLFLMDRWLPQQGFFGRVLGYMTTAGITAEFLKYGVLRYTVWPGRIRQRVDGVAYALAVSLGFALAYNLRAALFTDATLSAVALRVASNTFSQVAVSVLMGFFLSELLIGRVPVFWLPLGLGLASFLSGLYYAFRNIAIVSGVSVTGSGSAPIRGLLLAFGFLALTFTIVSFIIESADTRMEALTGRRHA